MGTLHLNDGWDHIDESPQETAYQAAVAIRRAVDRAEEIGIKDSFRAMLIAAEKTLEAMSK